MNNIYTSSNSTCTVTWSPTFSNNTINAGTIGAITSSSYSLVSWALKRCRECKHAHAEVEKSECYDIDQIGNFSFVTCKCKEYVPSDNLEYVEWCYERRSKRGSNEIIKKGY